jgi:hypothetical protein
MKQLKLILNLTVFSYNLHTFQQWDSILQSLEMSCPPEAKKLNALIRIYVALIPHRNNFSTEDKTDAMIQLKEYFEIGTDECTNDEEMLGYFALPYVADLNKHPIFSKILTVIA